MDLSICLVNYNAKQFSQDCIQSIINRTRKYSYEIILVDNNSSDNSCEEIARNFPSVVLIKNKKNLGFAIANNQALKISKGKYVILLNNDTIVKNEALDKMIDYLEKDQKVGGITCKLFEADGLTIQKNCRAFPSPFGTMFGRASLLTKIFPNNPLSAKNLLSGWDYGSIREIDWASGAALMIRREVLDQIGMLDEKYYIYWEDTDLCKRIKGAGWKIIFLPEAEIIHFTGKGGGKRSLRLKLFTMFQMHRSAYYYFRKHHYPNPFHPMALIALAGAIILVTGKGIDQTLKHRKN